MSSCKAVTKVRKSVAKRSNPLTATSKAVTSAHKYFLSYYGRSGIFSKEALWTVTRNEYAQAWTDLKAASAGKDNFQDGDVGDSFTREAMRDRLLLKRTGDYDGYIFSSQEKGSFGVSDLLTAVSS
jgi:hypothetical protein